MQAELNVEEIVRDRSLKVKWDLLRFVGLLNRI